ncbi:MAG: hypothetical protein FWH59_00500 [Lentimicrobiaceae bacterium]|nr:hypothetical protein [Lentimicrobiaceae bacterium]
MTKKRLCGDWKTTPKTSKKSLKNICITTMILLILPISSFGQALFLRLNTKYLEGDSLGKSYQIQLTSAVGKKQIVDDFISFLDEFDICDKKELQSRIDEIDDQTKDFSVDFALPVPIFPYRMLGDPPLLLLGELQFQFYNNETVFIDFKDWSELIFLRYNNSEQNFNIWKISDPAIDEWNQYFSERIGQSTFLYKATAVLFNLDPAVNANLKEMASNIKNALRKDWYENMEKEYPMYEKLEELKLGKWFSDYEYIEYFSNQPIANGYSEKNKKASLDVFTSFLEQNKLLALSETRWEQQVRPLLSDFFKYLAFYTGSNVIAVAEDGKTTYYNINGMILPVDPKWGTMEDGTPIVPSDPKNLNKYIKNNIKNQY